jgi:4-amino-4-deoxy-L-arabinose transferase-like glycosyltransferase
MAPLSTSVAPVPGTHNGRPAPFHARWWEVTLVVFVAFFLRVYHVGAADNFIDDSNVHVLTSLFYWRTGFLGPDAWWSPPFKHLLTIGGIAFGGNDEMGWRIKGVVWGALSVLAVFLIARRAFRHRLPAYSAAILLALDPFSIGLAHTTHEDAASVTFVLLGLLFFLRGTDDGKEWEWFVSGTFFGAACALRWFALVPLTVAGLTALWFNRKRLEDVVGAAITFSVAPFAVYLATYLPWLSRGYSLAEWLSLQFDAFKIQGPGFQGLPADLMSLEGAGRWFVTWVGGGSGLEQGSSTLSLLMNDPVIWIFFVPSAVLLCWVGIKRGHVEWTALGASFLGLYAFFLISPRQIVLYSAMGVVPLGFIALGFAIAYVFKQRGKYVFAALALWSLYLFPMVGLGLMPHPMYGWIVKLVVR